MPVWRNFFLGSEMTKGPWPLRRLDIERMKKTADEELRNMGIVLDDLEQPIGTLSGGQRQCVAIARAVYFGARVLILDEPTAALGVKQSGVVLKYIAAARDRGLGVIFITHNPHHAYMVGDHFSVLRLGTMELSAARSEVSLEELTNHMAGGAELAALKHELAQVSGVDVEELPEAEDLTAPTAATSEGKS
jgi:simple sugar transport system ATP-binding protein